MNIIALSGGKASAYCANIALQKYGKENCILYFNDTKWEHPDLYRFLNDLSKYFGIDVTSDSDGRDPEEIFYYKKLLGNNRVPLCSRILKAERLQKYFKEGDNIIFGIGVDEVHRAKRLISAYQKYAVVRNVYPTLEFPLIENDVNSEHVDKWLKSIGIKQPALYDLGFKHNNCSGGCVRAGKKHWIHLLRTIPEVYAKRESMEVRFREWIGKDVTILKDETLKNLRERYQLQPDMVFDLDDDAPVECIGICDLLN
jgi:hypothetical protein